MKKTYLVIKPSAGIAGSAIIFGKLNKLHLDRVSWNAKTQVWISPEQVRALYVGSPEPILRQTVEEMIGRLSVIRFTAQSESVNIVNRVALLRGSNINPVLCEPGTLRREVVSQVDCQPIWLEEGKYIYYPNFVHIPQTIAEARVCESIFDKFFV